MVPVPPVIIGITFAFTFLVCCVSVARSLYFNIFLVSFFYHITSPSGGGSGNSSSATVCKA